MEHGMAPGASARDQHRRHLDARYARHRTRVGAWLEGESELERRWRRGAEGEEAIGARLEELLNPHGVAVLHDLRVPGSRANIDHLCVGPGGVTVVDSKNYAGKVRKRSGGLWVNGRNRTRLIEAVLAQIDVVRGVLDSNSLLTTDVRGALCWHRVGKLPLMSGISIDGVLVDGSRPVAKLARRKADAGKAIEPAVVGGVLLADLGRSA